MCIQKSQKKYSRKKKYPVKLDENNNHEKQRNPTTNTQLYGTKKQQFHAQTELYNKNVEFPNENQRYQQRNLTHNTHGMGLIQNLSFDK